MNPQHQPPWAVGAQVQLQLPGGLFGVPWLYYRNGTAGSLPPIHIKQKERTPVAQLRRRKGSLTATSRGWCRPETSRSMSPDIKVSSAICSSPPRVGPRRKTHMISVIVKGLCSDRPFMAAFEVCSNGASRRGLLSWYLGSH